ncbi:MAG: sigma-54-dependent transcriptional regulator [Gemmataceae bacterium]
MAAPQPPLVLVADDDQSIHQGLRYHLERWDYRMCSAETKAELYRNLTEQEPSILLLDLCFGEHDGTEILQEVLTQYPQVVVVMFTGAGSIPNAVNAMKLGAFDYLTKPLDLTQLKIALDHGVEKRSRSINEAQESPHDADYENPSDADNAPDSARVWKTHAVMPSAVKRREPQPVEFRSVGTNSLLLGESQAMRLVREQIATVAPTDATVLILGESGTGKELVAREIHQKNTRRDGPFVPINMAALPRELAESTLFGHVKGAFTGADQPQLGCCEAAHGGTLFLDEIGEMEPSLQGKLLRFLQEHTIQRVGSSNVKQVDVRIVAATNRDLLERVNSGFFRRDLYYRLNVVPIELPPLRDRREDVPSLAIWFLRHFAHKHSKPATGFAHQAMQILVRCPWPGNVRQLENLIERLVILNHTNIIEAKDLPSEVHDTSASDMAGSIGSIDIQPHPDFLDEAPGDTDQLPSTQPILPLKELEKQAIIQALHETKGNVREAARLLGKGQATVYRKIKEHGIILEERGRTPHTEN